MTTEQARPGSLEPAHDAAVTWRYMAPKGHTLEMVTHVGYWRHNARECGRSRYPGRHAWNKIEVIAEDGSWEADLRVVSINDGEVHTRVLRVWRDEAAAVPAPDGYTVEHVPSNGWRALDGKGHVVIEKQQERGKALQAAVDHNDRMKGKR